MSNPVGGLNEELVCLVVLFNEEKSIYIGKN